MDGWKFDYTIIYSSNKRIPSTISNPLQYQRPYYSSAYTMMNAGKQINRKGKYIGIVYGQREYTNYIQNDAIIAADQPFSPYFDASLVWGSVTGRMSYTGIRYRMK